MSANVEEEKEAQKTLPLDLARNQITTVRTVEGKAPLVMTSQSLRGVRVLAQGVSSSSNPASVGQTIITTNIVPQAVIKQGDSGRTQITGIITSTQAQPQASSSLTLQRPTQITLSTTPLVAQSVTGTSYHVPRGPAVVANLAAPRSNVTTVRTPLVVTAQTGQAHTFIRPPRTPSPAQGTAWLNTSNGSQIKGASTVLSSPVRGVTVTGKPQIRAQQSPTMSTIRPGTILQNAITIGQSGQIHSFKPAGSNIQGLGNTVTIGQMLPNRTQAVVYSANTAAGQFTPARITVASAGTIQGQRPLGQARPTAQLTGARLTVPVNINQQPRLVTAQQATVLTSGAARLPIPQPQVQQQSQQQAAPSQQQTTPLQQATPNLHQQPTGVLGGTTARIVTSQPNVAIGRLAATPTSVSSTNLLGQARISTLNFHSLVAVANNAAAQGRGLQAQGAKVITQPAQGTIHLTPLSSQIKTTANVVTTGARTINVPAAIVTQQRGATVVPPQAISIAKVFPSSENQGTPGATTNVFIHAPLQAAQRLTSPSPGPTSTTATNAISQQQPANTTIPTTSIASYSLAGGTYFYDAAAAAAAGNYARPFGQQQASAAFAALQQVSQAAAAGQQQSQQQQQVRAQSVGGQVHGLMTNPQMRFNSVMVVEQSRGQQQQQYTAQQSQPNQLHQQTQQSAVQQQQQQSQLQQAQLQQSQLQQQINQATAEQHQQLQGNQHQELQQPSKMTSSPRPSILRKRDHEGSPLKAAKNLTPLLHAFQGLQQPLQQQAPTSPMSSPRPDSRGNGQSSGGSTTISATSSPGLPEHNDDSNPPAPMNHSKDDEDTKPPIEMSPRKKPRKQQLTNDVDEHVDDMQFISENPAKKENNDSEGNQSDEPKDGAPEATQVTTVRKPASASLLNGYRQTWKATHNHYQRYSDVRPKDERRPTIMDLANQCRVQEKVNGWKIHHLSTQMEDLAEQEQTVYNQLTELLKCTESEENNKQFDKEINRVNELIKGNLQRIKIINDGMIEAKTQIMKIFDHKVHVTDIINRCASKRNFKKRDKS